VTDPTDAASNPGPIQHRRRRILRWVLLGIGVLVAALVVVVAIVVVPIVTHDDQGTSTQEDTGEAWPDSVTATGDDGRMRELTVSSEDGGTVGTAALVPGQRLVVTGSGFDGSQGIYVAICVVDASPAVKPGPCIGGVPETDGDAADEGEVGAIEWSPSTWINDDWAWKLFGARPYDDVAAGAFTAYIEVGDPAVDGVDCSVSTCAIVTRNDHTAAADRVQDVRIPVAFAN
jgi:hypothetical protein